jgi:hypothetical protein
MNAEYRIKKTAAEIRQEMYELGYMYYPAEKVFKKRDYDHQTKTMRSGEMIVKTWREARDFCEIPE